MTDLTKTEPPDHLDWQTWVERWDRMQEHYVVRRSERFEIIIHTIGETQPSVTRVLDLGCGAGSLMLPLLEAFPDAQVFGVDFDPTMLWLARARLSRFGDRARIVLADLRDPSWRGTVPGSIDAAVSATALHWLSSAQLAALYRQLSQIIRPGGIFLNADHVGSDAPGIQSCWERRREGMRAEQGMDGRDDWDGFWNAYSEALGLDAQQIHQRVVGSWEAGVEEGLPLAWHLDTLRESGFAHVDCFWRRDCDAIYGGTRQEEKG